MVPRVAGQASGAVDPIRRRTTSFGGRTADPASVVSTHRSLRKQRARTRGLKTMVRNEDTTGRRRFLRSCRRVAKEARRLHAQMDCIIGWRGPSSSFCQSRRRLGELGAHLRLWSFDGVTPSAETDNHTSPTNSAPGADESLPWTGTKERITSRYLGQRSGWSSRRAHGISKRARVQATASGCCFLS